jgi:protein TonB
MNAPTMIVFAPLQRAHDVLSPGAQRALLGAMLGAHLLAGWALLQVPAVRQVAADFAPIRVDLIAPVPQAPPKPVPPPPHPVQPRTPPPPAPLLAAAPPPVPQPAPVFTAPPPPEPPALPVPTAPIAPPAPPTPAPQAVPAPAPSAPRKVVLTDTDWVRPPAYAYPREAARLREQGTVVVRIRFDLRGVPSRVELLRSSGSTRLDDEVLAKARAARAKPRLQDGVPIEFLADSEAEFKF